MPGPSRIALLLSCCSMNSDLKQLQLDTKKGCILKTAVIKQAFCQSTLPQDENYICEPPPGWPLMLSSMYWKLKKTLYGLKCNLRYCYELAKKLLESMRSKQNPTSSCLFLGAIISVKPPLYYLDLYVDDFIYFSKDEEAKGKFQQALGNKTYSGFKLVI